MHVLLACIGCSDFVWYVSLVLSMFAGIDGVEGSSVGVWREFISGVQVQVLLAVFRLNFPGFHQNFPNFSKFDGFGTKRIFITHRIFEH
jgi:hypothetical protein